MWAPFFEFPWEEAATGQQGSHGGGSASGASASTAATRDVELGSTSAAPVLSMNGGSSDRSAQAATAAFAATAVGKSAASHAASTSAAGNKAAAASANGASGAGGSSSSSAQAASSGAGGGAARRMPLAGGELKMGAVNIGVRADGLQVRGLRIAGGTGRCLAGVPIVQDRAYWEVHLVEVGGDLSARLLVGTCVRPAAGSDILLQELGATPRSHGVQFGAGGEAPLRTGDVLGVAYDQAVFPVEIKVWLNGQEVAAPLPRGLKGEQWPALFLASCTVDWALDESHWKHRCPEGFSPVMPSRGLIGDGS
eukprot:TRINITY_DN18087_c1_g1_i1.p1 TRINITY_DN18087_c1_g1~~TRINITY_DN18087_c1_g1_i1.p1  ORF type:complete len:309 (-),score=66.47 TRINITY_DN18087_c1_g1_i1:57-983(-)